MMEREERRNAMKMIFKSPANGWHEAFILGNGRIGAAVYGGTKREQIALNEDTLWSGYPAMIFSRRMLNLASGYGVYPVVRRQV